ncbi:hypothetical protein EV426DRAFT_237417 [Tirmania nivea]|nr:hypothetical protein EV426DRAFT_237417 [Tirmania nivea]
MSRSKKLGSIYANNRKRRVVSDDEHSEDESIVENVNHSVSKTAEDMKRNNHNDHAGNGHNVDPEERCQAKLRSLRQHLAILRHEAAEVEKEIARWEWEAAAAAKAAKVRARGAERASAQNCHMLGYAMSGAGAQKRRRVLPHLNEEEDEADLWGPAGTARGGRFMHELFPAPGKSTANGNKGVAWEHAMDEDGDHEDDDHHSAVEINDMDMAMEHDTDEDSGASTWGKLIDKVPSPRQDFEVVIERFPSILPLHGSTQPEQRISEGPLFFGSIEDFSDNEGSPKPAPLAKPKQTPNLCFSPLALSAPAAANKGSNPPLSLLPSTPMRLATRARPPSGEGFSGGGECSGEAGSITSPTQLITPKRPPTTAISSSTPHSAGKIFVPSQGFFGTYEEKRKLAGLEPLLRVEFDEFEGGITKPQVSQTK